MSTSPQRRMRKVAEKKAVKELKDTELREIADRRTPIKTVGHAHDLIGVGITQAMAHHTKHYHTPWWARLLAYIRDRTRLRQFQRQRDSNEGAYNG